MQILASSKTYLYKSNAVHDCTFAVVDIWACGSSLDKAILFNELHKHVL